MVTLDFDQHILKATYNPATRVGDGVMFMWMGQIWNMAKDAPFHDEAGNIIGTILSVEETANNGECDITIQITSEEGWKKITDFMHGGIVGSISMEGGQVG